LKVRIWIPQSFLFKHLVEDGEQFSHGSGDNDLEGFAGGFEPCAEGLEAVVAEQCIGGHRLEGIAGVGASSLDGAFAVPTLRPASRRSAARRSAARSR